jgi:hypothetical protein
MRPLALKTLWIEWLGLAQRAARPTRNIASLAGTICERWSLSEVLAIAGKKA